MLAFKRTLLPTSIRCSRRTQLIFGIVQQQIGEFSALLDKVDVRESCNALAKTMDAHQFAEDDARIVETQRLIKIS